jgi:hypothetical protein
VDNLSESGLRSRQRAVGLKMKHAIDAVIEQDYGVENGSLGMQVSNILGTDYRGNNLNFNFGNGVRERNLDITVKVLDMKLISRESYRKLAAAQPQMICADVVEKRKREITKLVKIQVPIYFTKISSLIVGNKAQNSSNEQMMTKPPQTIGFLNFTDNTHNLTTNFNTNVNAARSFTMPEVVDRGILCEAGDPTLLHEDGEKTTIPNEIIGTLFNEGDIDDFAWRSIKDILMVIVTNLHYKEKSIAAGDTLLLKLSGDGRNVGRNVKHTMITLCLLNEGEKVLSPYFQYTIGLYVGSENYDTLAAVFKKACFEITDLQQNGFIDANGVVWPTLFFFTADWKFMALALGLNAANAKYFCFYCHCTDKERWNVNQIWTVEKDMNQIIQNFKAVPGHIHPCLLKSIPLSHWILDELHLMLRISDVLFDTLWFRLTKDPLFKETILKKLKAHFQSIGVKMEFYKTKDSGEKWFWTSLMGPARLKILKSFDHRLVSLFFFC